MRKLILLDNTSLDGHLARRFDANAAVLFGVDDRQFDWQADALATVDTLLIGRVSYVMAATFYPGHPSALAARLNAMTKVVFTSTLRELPWTNSRFATAEPADELARLRAEPGGDIAIKGSPTLARAFSRLGLIDEYVFLVHPRVAGSDGVPAFTDSADLPPLRLTAAAVLPGDAAALTYMRS